MLSMSAASAPFAAASTLMWWPRVWAVAPRPRFAEHPAEVQAQGLIDVEIGATRQVAEQRHEGGGPGPQALTGVSR